MSDGTFYAEGRFVRRKPLATKMGDRSERIQMGFAVCEVCDGVSDDAAAEIAAGLNLLLLGGKIR